MFDHPPEYLLISFPSKVLHHRKFVLCRQFISHLEISSTAENPPPPETSYFITVFIASPAVICSLPEIYSTFRIFFHRLKLLILSLEISSTAKNPPPPETSYFIIVFRASPLVIYSTILSVFTYIRMTRIAAYFDVNEHMCYKELYTSLRSKLDSIIDMNNIDIYICLGPIECVKKDLAITNDNDVKWVYHIIISNVERYIALIVHFVGSLIICLGSSSSSSFQTQIHDYRSRFFENITMSEYVTVKSNKEVMILQCAIRNCKWSLRTSCCIYGDRSLWVFTRFDSEHTCSVDVPLTDHRQVTFTVIKDLIKNKISLAGFELLTPKDIVHFIRVKHGLSISYQKAWRAREPALDDIRGSLEDSYKMLPRFAYILKLNNPNSVVEYKVDADGRFLYFFIALSDSISGWQHCCLVISIDGTSLKNKYGDTLSASIPDAND
uniref:Protein FAR-RED ELONGATED HYPOCOTYL 3-like n=1 Tax=Cucumis melo TaxID=3656 RepID=A0A9I9EKN5_CUCME